MSRDAVALDRHIFDLTAFDGGNEIRKCEAVLLAPLRSTLKQVKESKHQKRDNDPKRQISTEIQILDPSLVLTRAVRPR